MYIYIIILYIYIYIYIYNSIHTVYNIYIYIYIIVYIQCIIYIYIYIYIYIIVIYTYIHTHTHTYIYVCVCMSICMYACIRIKSGASLCQMLQNRWTVSKFQKIPYVLIINMYYIYLLCIIISNLYGKIYLINSIVKLWNFHCIIYLSILFSTGIYNM